MNVPNERLTHCFNRNNNKNLLQEGAFAWLHKYVSQCKPPFQSFSESINLGEFLQEKSRISLTMLFTFLHTKHFPGTYSQSNEFFPQFMIEIGAIFRGILYLEWPG